MNVMDRDQMREYLSKGFTLYATGMQLQIEYEIKCENDPTDADKETLKHIKRDNKKLYDVMKHFTRELMND
jgi:hypothetical protein